MQNVQICSKCCIKAFGVRALPAAGELTALPRTLSWKRERRAGEEQGREREGRKKREGKEKRGK